LEITELKKLVSKERGDVGVDLYLVPFGNLMTIMMIFFLILWAFSQSDSRDSLLYEKVINSIEKSFGVKTEKREKEVEMAQKMATLFKEKGLSKAVQVNVSARSIKMILRTPVLFSSGSSGLQPEIVPVLDAIIKYISQAPGFIRVEGHTDNIPLSGGKYKSNYTLSAARAFEVVKYLEQQGVNPARLSVVGYGEYEPMYSNDTLAGRSLNRRIEISITRSY
jgi:chemotaxis protein MotB